MDLQFVTSRDGTAIAYETLGDGPPLIAVCGTTCDRALMRPTARALGAVNYDRRGRADSGDTLPYAIEREIDDLAALIGVVGGSAHLYGHSSGAALVLHAVAAGLPVDRFVLHDPPYSPGDDPEARRYASELSGLLADDRRADALKLFFLTVGMPEEMVGEMESWPSWPGLLALAPTLAYDSAVMGDGSRGGAIPEDVAARASRPALVLVGDQSPPFMADVGHRLAELLPDGRFRALEGQGHEAAPEVVAPVVAEFLSGAGA
jgi:pimeloyl-ACP methyl ester carboxylesterase